MVAHHPPPSAIGPSENIHSNSKYFELHGTAKLEINLISPQKVKMIFLNTRLRKNFLRRLNIAINFAMQ
jgi:hypothetical protein